MKSLIAFIFFISLFLACASGSNTPDDETAGDMPLTFEMMADSFKGNGQVYEGDSIYATMLFEYPVFSGGKTSVAEKINAYMAGIIHNTNIGISDTVKATSTSKPLREIADGFFADAKENANPENVYASAWAYEVKTDTLMVAEDKAILSLRHSYYTYTGGAHPNHYADIVNIDLKTGEIISQETLFANDPQLLATVQKYFIANEKKMLAEAKMEFSMKDYWFENGFTLPSSMGLTREGIYCLYNPYEVAPYARGDIEFTVPYAEVKKKFW